MDRGNRRRGDEDKDGSADAAQIKLQCCTAAAPATPYTGTRVVHVQSDYTLLYSSLVLQAEQYSMCAVEGHAEQLLM